MRMFAHVMNADANVNRRRTARRALMLDAVAHTDADQTSEIIIHNLSQTGLLIESQAEFAVGEIFYLHLPEIGATPAQVRRKDQNSYGCEFLAPVAKVVISAALLKSAFELPDDESAQISDQKIAAARFFGEQALPINQAGTPVVYMMSAIFAMLVAALAFVTANGDLIIN